MLLRVVRPSAYVRLYVCLSHSCTMLKPFDGMRYHLAETLLCSQVTLYGAHGKGIWGRNPQFAAALLLLGVGVWVGKPSQGRSNNRVEGVANSGGKSEARLYDIRCHDVRPDLDRKVSSCDCFVSVISSLCLPCDWLIDWRRHDDDDLQAESLQDTTEQSVYEAESSTLNRW